MPAQPLGDQVSALEREAQSLRKLVAEYTKQTKALKDDQAKLQSEIEVYKAKNHDIREANKKYEAIIETKDAEIVDLHTRFETVSAADKKQIEDLKISLGLARKISQNMTTMISRLEKQARNNEGHVKRLIPILRVKVREAYVRRTALQAAFRLLPGLGGVTTFKRLLELSEATVRDQLVNLELVGLLNKHGVILDEIRVSPSPEQAPITTPEQSPTRMLTRSAKKRRLFESLIDK